MKKLLMLLAFVGGIVGIAAVIGATLPRDHTASMTVTVNAPQVKVWTTITEPAEYASWRKGLKSVDVISRAPLSWKETDGSGEMTLQATVFQAPSRMVAEIEDNGQPFGGEWEYQIAPHPSDPNKSNVTITERGWVSNVLFRFVSRFVMGHDSSIDKYLRALSAKFGPEVAPTRLTAKDSS